MGEADEQCIVHKLYLVRHCETIHNVKGIYAGVLDSAPTLHGIQQATLLGQRWSKNNVHLSHIFSSNLQRAVKTAEIIRQAQTQVGSQSIVSKSVEELREQDMGYYEGKPFNARSANSTKTGKEEHHDKHKDDPAFRPPESKDSMAERANVFLDYHLYEILGRRRDNSALGIVVVSHGIFLGTLWRALLARQLPGSVILDDEVASHAHPSLEHLGGWSNTGYLELELRKTPRPSGQQLQTCINCVSKTVTGLATSATTTVPVVPARIPSQPARSEAMDGNPQEKHCCISHYKLLVKAVNSREHLKSLKRNRGVGSSAYDASQSSIASFFPKKQKTG